MSTVIFASSSTPQGREISLNVDGVANRFSFQISIVCPFPTCQRCPCRTIFCSAIMLLHAYDGWCPILAERKSPLGKYLALNTLWTSEVVRVYSHQPCFARSTKLKAFRSRNPKPPSFLGRHILSQLNQVILFLSLAWPHQNLQTKLVFSSHKALGSLKTLIVYVGTAWAIVLIKISLPALDNSFSFQLDNLLFNLSINWWKVFHLIFPTEDGRPKYFPCSLIISPPKRCFISSCVS